MEAALATLGILLIVPAFAISVFFLIIHPIWAIIDVAISTNKTTGEKVLWIVLIFIVWTLGSLVYGFVFATRPLAITTRVLFLSLLALIMAFGVLALAAPFTIERLRDRIDPDGLSVSARLPVALSASLPLALQGRRHINHRAAA